MAEPSSPTGAGGSTGTTAGGAPTVSTGSTGTTPPPPGKQVPNPNANAPAPAKKPASLSETQEGAKLIAAYDQLRDSFQTTLPALVTQLTALARRPIGG